MSDDRWDEGYGPLMVDGKVGGLGVVVTPRRKVIVSLAGAAVHLDLHATHRLHTKIFDRFKNICAAMCHCIMVPKNRWKTQEKPCPYGWHVVQINLCIVLTKGFLLIADCRPQVP